MKNYYVVTSTEGGDSDVFYYIFTEKSYFDAFINLANIFNSQDDDEFKNEMQVYIDDGLFSEYTDYVESEDICCDDFEDIFSQYKQTVLDIKAMIEATKDGTVVETGETIIC